MLVKCGQAIFWSSNNEAFHPVYFLGIIDGGGGFARVLDELQRYYLTEGCLSNKQTIFDFLEPIKQLSF